MSSWPKITAGSSIMTPVKRQLLKGMRTCRQLGVFGWTGPVHVVFALAVVESVGFVNEVRVVLRGAGVL